MNIDSYRPLREAILAWHDENARDLPWRGEKDPYRIWISEIMLQQTRAQTVVPYYLRFISSFPTVQALALADIDQVLKNWEGLGYYSRARNLHRAAQMVAEAGAFPGDARGLRDLPGVGEYTAGAISSMAYGLAEPAIDANQLRVLSRLFAVREMITLPETRARLRREALALIDRERPGDFNQALMGMGALVCLARKPACERCPARGMCLAREMGAQEEIPLLPEKTPQRKEKRAVALVFWDDGVLVRRRPEKGLLGGLWEFPHFTGALDDAAVREALGEMGVRVKKHRLGPKARHVFTHLVWEMTGHIYEAADGAGQGVYVNAREMQELAFPTALRVYREEALARLKAL